MNDDDELCLCFHVTRRKVIQYIRVRQPRRPSELSQCYGAGTGCGWCRPFLKRLLDQEQAGSLSHDEENLPTPEEYARQRSAYRQQGG
ncbi:(2Fe-2S)-binding protein [Allorhodopirellula solitaria]|uniref:BFD-like [2Fe-2S] binding domain protein n=1 Tax=Allorhodopirellula solitaria TaxID=2527987 RepID=A0A5C5X7Y6_9BACT|nr:(2Fe-2S)-binding protein [Allorhodopirellula solitaria]TWT59257.1 BFD-like [2Fe-2S] binding domain protein [Allorhodopirellula solitaria]